MVSITIHLQGNPGFRTGAAQIGDRTFALASWHKQAGGEVHATTGDGQRVTLATDNGSGGITIGAERWLLRGCRWVGAEMRGTATLAVTDAEMAAMFPDAGWVG